MKELLAAGRRRVAEVWMTESSDPSPILGEIDRLAREAHVPVRLVSERRLESTQGTEAPQGVLAFAEPIQAVTLQDLVFGRPQRAVTSGKAPAPVAESGNDYLDDEDDEDDDSLGIVIELDSDADDVDGERTGDDSDVVVPLVEVVDELDDTADGGESFAEEAASVADLSLDEAIEVALEEASRDEPEGGEPGSAAEDDELTTAGAAEEAETPESGEQAEDVEAREDASLVTAAAVEKALASATSAATAGDQAFVVVLEGVTDPQNLGAILRSAECAGVTGVALPRHRSVHVTPAVTKAAAGAVEHLPMALVPGVPSALQDLDRLGVLTVGLDERGSTSIYDLDVGDRPVALVLGSESTGLSSLARRRCEVLCRIPVSGGIPSLNVSAAAAVACFEVSRQRARASSRRP